MEGKVLSFPIKGMQRDLSRSKFNPEYSYENKNVRIVSHGDGTLFSITNERGQRKINLISKEPKLYKIRIHGNVYESSENSNEKYKILIYGNVNYTEVEVPKFNITIKGNISEQEQLEPEIHSITIHGNASYNENTGPLPKFEFETNVVRLGRRTIRSRVYYSGPTDDSTVFTHNLPQGVTFSQETSSLFIRSDYDPVLPVGTYTISAAYKGIQRDLLIIIEDWCWECSGADYQGQFEVAQGQSKTINLIVGPTVSYTSILSGVDNGVNDDFISLPHNYNSSGLAYSITRASSSTVRLSVTRNTTGSRWGGSIILSTNPEIEDPYEPWTTFGGCVVTYLII